MQGSKGAGREYPMAVSLPVVRTGVATLTRRGVGEVRGAGRRGARDTLCLAVSVGDVALEMDVGL